MNEEEADTEIESEEMGKEVVSKPNPIFEPPPPGSSQNSSMNDEDDDINYDVTMPMIDELVLLFGTALWNCLVVFFQFWRLLVCSFGG
ncbi:hypothetical protein RHMOL_Rhmol05G0190600 [Rhododendron molle]|uniref:Uncharacterized protein n=1 Tax=Rhododendron molle TaxID=49168 RepID=A0ACC0NSU1_RHOML|nr:hypothetical protein RHMOL_Rhmol05G0190600 [Rhododendron molle]